MLPLIGAVALGAFGACVADRVVEKRANRKAARKVHDMQIARYPQRRQVTINRGAIDFLELCERNPEMARDILDAYAQEKKQTARRMETLRRNARMRGDDWYYDSDDDFIDVRSIRF